MEVKLNKIYRSDKDKNGNPLKTQDGRAYTRVAIQTQEHGTKWLSGFENRANANWKEGGVVEINVEQKGEYLNFRTLSEFDKLWMAIRKIQEDINFIRNSGDGYPEVGGHVEDVNLELEEAKVKVEDLPF